MSLFRKPKEFVGYKETKARFVRPKDRGPSDYTEVKLPDGVERNLYINIVAYFREMLNELKYGKFEGE